MAYLFEMAKDFEELFNRFDDIDNIEFDVNEDGEPIDLDGNVVDPETYIESLKQQWFDTLAGIEDDFNYKAANMAQYIKHLKVQSDGMESEIKNLKSRKSTIDKKIESMKQYIKNCMDDLHITKIDTAMAKLSIRNNAESVQINDEIGFIEWCQNNDREELLKYEQPSIRKTDLKKKLQLGEKFDGVAELIRTQSLIIK